MSETVTDLRYERYVRSGEASNDRLHAAQCHKARAAYWMERANGAGSRRGYYLRRAEGHLRQAERLARAALDSPAASGPSQ
jgi:hypothetical protein